jgi:hypothetical protein
MLLCAHAQIGLFRIFKLGESQIKRVELRIFSREANFSFVFIQLVPHGSSCETKDK